MYLLYLDESGDANSWNSQQHFVLAGCAVFESAIWRIAEEFDRIEQNYAQHFQQRPVAFHATDLKRGKKDFKWISTPVLTQMMHDVYDSISSFHFPEMVLFATVIHRTKAQSEAQVIHDTFQDICSRFNILLTRLYNADKPNKGLLVIDQAHKAHYRSLIADFRSSGTRYGQINNIVDIPYFAERYDTRMLQVADFCAYAVFRYYERNDRTYFDKLLESFDRTAPGGNPEGLKHIIDRDQSCTCEACSFR